MQKNTPRSFRPLDAEEALVYGAHLTDQTPSEFIRAAIKEKAENVLERIASRKQAVEPER